MVKAHHPVAQLPLRHTAPDRNHPARQLMPQNLWRIDVALKNLLNVRPANPAYRHLDEHFPVAHLRHRHLFDLHHTLVAVHPGPHRLRYRPQRPHLLHYSPRPAHRAPTPNDWLNAPALVTCCTY